MVQPASCVLPERVATNPRKQGRRPIKGRSILLHDFGGYPFIFQLAAELAQRGHTVEYVYCGSNPTTPVGVGETGDLLNTRVIHLPKSISKGAFVERMLLERRYGRQLAEAIQCSRPEIVVLSNTPVDALGPAIRATQRVGATLVIWVQDLLGEAALRVLRRQIGPLGNIIGRLYRRREGRLLARADHLITITEDFAPALGQAGISAERWTVIPNWAPLDSIQPCPKVNPWSLEQGIHDKTVLLYSGSIGFKHKPGLILRLARALQDRDDVVIVVNSEGSAADWLRAEAERNNLNQRLRVNNYQPFEKISEVLGSADVLLAILDRQASAVCVPSKVLSNISAGRAQLVAIPSENLAAKIVREAQCGIVCDPCDEEGFVNATLALLQDAEKRLKMGRNARQYALREFQIEGIAARFEGVFEKVAPVRDIGPANL